MRERSQTLLTGFLAAIAVASLAVGTVAGQAAAPAKTPAMRAMARMPDCHPDLQGTYDLATLTPVERRAGQPLVLTKATTPSATSCAARG